MQHSLGLGFPFYAFKMFDHFSCQSELRNFFIGSKNNEWLSAPVAMMIVMAMVITITPDPDSAPLKKQKNQAETHYYFF